MTRGKKKKGSEIEKFDFELDKMTKKDKKNVLELIKRVRKQSDELTRQQSSHESFKKELEKLKEEYACVTNTFSCVTSLKEENQQLKDQLEKISSKYVNLQATHKELECSYEKLVESHTLLDVANEVMVNTLKFHEPFSHTCTSTQVKIALIHLVLTHVVQGTNFLGLIKFL